jgi:hypothetical protein
MDMLETAGSLYAVPIMGHVMGPVSSELCLLTQLSLIAFVCLQVAIVFVHLHITSVLLNHHFEFPCHCIISTYLL